MLCADCPYREPDDGRAQFECWADASGVRIFHDAVRLEDAARWLDVQPQTVRNWTTPSCGKLEKIRRNGRTYIPLDSLLALE